MYLGLPYPKCKSQSCAIMSMCVHWEIALFSISTDSSTGKSNDYGDYCVNGEGSGSNGPVANDIDCGGTADLKCTGGCLK